MIYFTLYFALVVLGGVIGFVGVKRKNDRVEFIGISIMSGCIVALSSYVIGSSVYYMFIY